jgi:hypothetical protein
MSNAGEIRLPSGNVKINQETAYPWQGKVNLVVDPGTASDFTLKVRIPGWATGEPVPGDLYEFLDVVKKPVTITVNGKQTKFTTEKGYAVLKRKWKKGDKVVLDLPMEARKVIAHENVKDDQGRFALQRGPVMYCLEWADNKDSLVQNLMVDKQTPINVEFRDNMLGGIAVLTAKGVSAKRQLNSDALLKSAQDVVAIPYYAWANRGTGEMMVWIPYEESAAKPKAAPTVASTSKVSSSNRNRQMYLALNDQVEPANSSDNANMFFHWWPKFNSVEWIQYDFDKETIISESQIYWFDDSPFGGTRVPLSYKILYKKGDEWLPVKNTTDYVVAKDKFNVLKFEPVKTTAVKVEVQLPEKTSSGLHEWVIK